MRATCSAAEFRRLHGPSANAMAFRVKDAAQAFKLAVERGAKPVAGPVGPMELNRLVDTFAQSGDEKVGAALIVALKASPSSCCTRT